MKTFCINLKHRKDRKRKMIKLFKKYNMDVEFFTAKLHKEGGIKGCLDSHLQVIKRAKLLHLPYVMILEDDLQFSQNLNVLPDFPPNWKLLYLGGTLTSNISETTDSWVQITDCWTTCGYILHSSMFDKMITDLETYKEEVDRYYVEHIQHDYPCYLINPLIVKQRNDYSDIEKRNVNYDQNLVLRNPYRDAIFERHGDEYILKTQEILEDDLPFVSIITPTRNRKELFVLAMHNFYNTKYPMNKLEWVIVDDGDDKINTILPDDKRIKYISLDVEGPLTVAHKRNIAVSNASHDIIVHMDDDDFYYPQHVLTRIQTLISNNVKCIGCTELGCYNILNQKSFKIGDKHSILSEASMCYYKQFWEERNFFERVRLGEALHFLKGRELFVVQIPFTYILIALTHSTNITSKLRSDQDEKINVVHGVNNLWNEFDSFVKSFLKKLYN